MSGKIEISRELLEDLLGSAQAEAIDRRAALGDFRPLVQAELDRIVRETKALLAAPVVERQEPVAVMKLEAERLWEGDGEYSISFVKSGWLDECRKTGGTFMLYAEQPAPVASNNLRNFANSMIDIALEGCNADGVQIQELAVEHGLLKPEQRTERCGDTCSCAEYADFPVECFRKVKELDQ